MPFTLRAFNLVLVLVVVLTLVTGVAAYAQSESNDTNLNLFVGNMLPNQIEGVEEIIPVFGGRYGLGTPAGIVEFGLLNSHAGGVDFTTFELNLRGDIPVLDGINGIVYAGADLNWYAPRNSDSRLTETGFHIGAGGALFVAGTLWLRSDLRFMGGPGTSLYLLFGIEFKSPQ